ncbi:BAG family molecular chaperone regulator 4 [Erpetoichthys calabaricus]|uniref:BCL2 associated athanogene 4 n=1 Tax=Erpetoichthys calabaricus TaxID=27687 RepID=A0A8C4X2F7_ERPCA|nr:BAG family molecular chaperone regulator 4 [Erpetoichthys calabaricus]
MSRMQTPNHVAYGVAVNDTGAVMSGGDPSWEMQHQQHLNPKVNWAHYNNSDHSSWPAPVVTGNQDAGPYQGYDSSYWYPKAYSTGPYSNTYPAGVHINGHSPYSQQGVPVYSNDAFHPAQYPGTPPLYTQGHHPSHPSYPPAHQEARPGPCELGAGGHSVHHHPYPCPQSQGAPQYSGSTYLPYGNGMTGVSQNPPFQNPPPSHPRTPVETWSHAPGGYGPPQNQWQTVPQAPPVAYGNPFLPPQSNSWLQAAPTAPPYEPKDPPYSTFPPDSQPSHPVVSNPRPLNLSTGQASEYSSPPLLYTNPGKNQKAQSEHQQNERDSLPPHFQKSDNPGVAQIQQVLQRVFHLEESVDEFVGYKTDKSYRCLEELLTKELLQLDSVETNGQELVRQVRKDAVQKVQGILDRLEKKAF